MDFYIREEWKAPAAVGVLSFAVGASVGYFVCNRRWTKLVSPVTDDIDEATEIIVKTSEIIQSEEFSKQLGLDFARAVTEQSQGPVRIRDIGVVDKSNAAIIDFPLPEPESDPEPEMDLDPDENWDQDEEEANRGPDAPYVIHREEFFANETGFDQADLEYFSGDDILVDENRVPLYNHVKLVGRLEFGRGSGDSDVVYIRNERERGEYQVTRVEHSYAQEVLGLEAEEEAEENDLRHSATVLKFRDV